MITYVQILHNIDLSMIKNHLINYGLYLRGEEKNINESIWKLIFFEQWNRSFIDNK